VNAKKAVDLLWNAIGSAALAGNKDVMVLRSFREGLSGNRRLNRVVRSELEQDCLARGFAGLSKWLKSLLGTDVDLAIVDRSAYRLALWLATCQQATEEEYRLAFDSIQHTCSVRIELDGKVGQVEPLRTAFAAGIASRSIISWADRAWNPVSSGFILDGQTS
jgi:hypothetical protein